MGKKIIKIAGVLLAAILACSGLTACKENSAKKPLSLIENSTSEYKVLLSENATECEEFAGKELVDYLQKVYGVRLETFRGGMTDFGENKKYISVGETAMFQNYKKSVGLQMDVDQMNLDGFVIKSEGDTLFIAGARDRGTLYGVYEFLTKFTGVKFIASDCIYVPKGENLRTDGLDITDIPDIPIRSYWSGLTKINPLYCAQQRMVDMSSLSSPQYGYGIYRDFYMDGHNTLKLSDAKNNFAEHPECFAEIKGERQPLDICWTNGITAEGTLDETMEYSTAKFLLEGLKKFIKTAHKDCTMFFVGQEDSQDYICSCEECTRVKDKYGAISAAEVRMLNVLAKEINKWSKEEFDGREIDLCFFAYVYSEDPPVKQDSEGNYYAVDNQVMLDEHVYVMIAPASRGNHIYSYIDERQLAWNKFMFDGWSVVTDHINVFDYTTNFNNFLMYHPNISTFKDNIEFFMSKNVYCLMAEAEDYDTELWTIELKTYIYSKLMWDVSLNVNELLEEYCRYYYGIVADDVLDYIYFTEAQCNKNKEIYGESWFWHMATDPKYHEAQYYPLNFAEKGVAILDNALKKIEISDLNAEEKSVYSLRVKNVRLSANMVILNNYRFYYGANGYLDFVRQYFADCDEVGIKAYSHGHIEEIRASAGV